jgi:hypothetical protein
MVAFLLVKKQKVKNDSRPDPAKTRVMVGRVKTGFGVRRGLAPAHQAARSTVFRTRAIDRVFVVVTARLHRQRAFAISKNRAVFLIRERASGEDQTVGDLGFGRQFKQRDGARNCRRAGFHEAGRQCRRCQADRI